MSETRHSQQLNPFEVKPRALNRYGRSYSSFSGPEFVRVMSVVRFVVLVVLFGLAAKADLVLWSPAGQNLTYILPEGVAPATYIRNVKSAQALAEFVEGMALEKQDKMEVIKPELSGAKDRTILIANRIEDHAKDHPRVDNFGRHLSRTFVLPVGAALKLNLKQEEKFFREFSEHFGLFVFMGGQDKDPGLYGEKNTWSDENTNRLRDMLEQRIIRFMYYKTSVKIFGVCRGLQQVFTALGGKLHQDINKDLPVEEIHKGGTFHSIKLAATKNSILAQIIKDLPQDYVDSHHHQAAKELSLAGTIFEVSARSPEGIIESLESRDGRVFLVQFHPELLDNLVKFTNGFFRRLRSWAQSPPPNFCGRLF